MSYQQFNPKNGNIVIKVESLEEIAKYQIKGHQGTIELVGSNLGTQNTMEYIKESGEVLASNTEDVPVGSTVYFHYTTLKNEDSHLDELHNVFIVRQDALIAVQVGEVLKTQNNWVLADWVYEDGVEIEDNIAFKRVGSLVIPCSSEPIKNHAKIVHCHDEELIGRVVLIDKVYNTKTFSTINGKRYLRFKYDDIHAIIN